MSIDPSGPKTKLESFLDIPVVLPGLPPEPDLVALLFAVLLDVLLCAIEDLLLLGVRSLELFFAQLEQRLLQHLAGFVVACESVFAIG